MCEPLFAKNGSRIGGGSYASVFLSLAEASHLGSRIRSHSSKVNCYFSLLNYLQLGIRTVKLTVGRGYLPRVSFPLNAFFNGRAIGIEPRQSASIFLVQRIERER
jgi:hypothetical protein